MNLRLSAILFLLVGLHCGQESSYLLSTRIQMSEALIEDATQLKIYAIAPKRADDIILTCDELMKRTILPQDELLDVLATTQLDVKAPTVEDPTATLKQVAEGDNRIVYVEALDQTNVVLANGCTDMIKVESGQVTSVTVTLFEI